MSLQRYHDNSWIRSHSTSREEVEDLRAIVDRDIAQSQTPGLSSEWRFAIAYNAALQLATLTLAVAGYQGERQNKHMRTIECLEFTMGLDPKEVAFLDRCRRKRHANVYDQVGAVSDQEANEMIAFATSLRDRALDWVKANRPELL